MSSDRKLRSCRDNGKKAKGTLSPEGIERSKYNALTHGLRADTVVLHTEDPAAHARLHQAHLTRLPPRDEAELLAVERLTACAWRLRRAVLVETATLDVAVERMAAELDQQYAQVDPAARLALAVEKLAQCPHNLALLQRYEAALDRAHERAWRHLERLRSADAPPAPLADAGPALAAPPDRLPAPAPLPEPDLPTPEPAPAEPVESPLPNGANPISGHPPSGAPNPCPSSDLPPLSPPLPNGANPISGHSPAPRLQPRPAAPTTPASAPTDAISAERAAFRRVLAAVRQVPGALEAIHAALHASGEPQEEQPHAA